MIEYRESQPNLINFIVHCSEEGEGTLRRTLTAVPGITINPRKKLFPKAFHNSDQRVAGKKDVMIHGICRSTLRDRLQEIIAGLDIPEDGEECHIRFSNLEDIKKPDRFELSTN